MRSPFGEILKMFGNKIEVMVVQHCERTTKNDTDLFTLKWLILGLKFFLKKIIILEVYFPMCEPYLSLTRRVIGDSIFTSLSLYSASVTWAC